MKSKIFLFCLLATLFMACDHIADDERLIEVSGTVQPNEPTTVTKNVLLEDFTGQRCVNCPRGTEVIEQLQEAFGDRLVAVGIHGGPLGFKGNAQNTGLATDLGDEYYNHWNLEYQPVGLIDRGSATNYPDWTRAVREALSLTAKTKIEAEGTLSGSTINIAVTTERIDDDYDGKLQVWVLEDSIVAMQAMPDGAPTNREYVHNHVLRTAVNGTWGQDITLTAGESRQLTFTQAVDDLWNTEHLSVVAFVYNDSGVEQVVKAKVNQQQ